MVPPVSRGTGPSHGLTALPPPVCIDRRSSPEQGITAFGLLVLFRLREDIGHLAPQWKSAAPWLRASLVRPHHCRRFPLTGFRDRQRSLTKIVKIQPILFRDTIPYPTSFPDQGFSRIRICAIKSSMKSNRNEDFDAPDDHQNSRFDG